MTIGDLRDNALIFLLCSIFVVDRIPNMTQLEPDQISTPPPPTAYRNERRVGTPNRLPPLRGLPLLGPATWRVTKNAPFYSTLSSKEDILRLP